MNRSPRIPEEPALECDRDLRGLLHSDGGLAALEFAILMPLMLLILFGFTELYLYMRAVSIVEHTAFTLADSIGQMNQVVNDNSAQVSGSLGSLWNAAEVLAVPNTLQAQGGVIITSICDNASTGCILQANGSKGAGTPQILWQAKAPWTQTGMATKETQAQVLPASWPFQKGDTAIAVEVFYKFTPFALTSVFWASAPGTQTIYERVYVRPRSGTSLNLVAG